MIARFEWHYRHQPEINHPPGGANRRGWVLISGLTLLFATWIGYRILRPGWLYGLSPVLGELLGLVEMASGFTLLVLWLMLWWRWWKRPFLPSQTLDIAQLYALNPSEFEQYVARLFQHKGYRVKLRGRSGDHGVDLELIRRGGKRAIVQCKRYRSRIGPDIARELYGTLIHERAAHAFLVTTADISDATREWAQGKPMTLIDGHTLVRLAAVLDGEQSGG